MRHKERQKQFSVILTVVTIIGLAVLLIAGFVSRIKDQPQPAKLLQGADGNMLIAIVGENPILFQLSPTVDEAECSGHHAVLQIKKCEIIHPELVCVEPKQDTWIQNRQSQQLQRNLQCASVPWYYYVDEFSPGSTMQARSQI